MEIALSMMLVALLGWMLAEEMNEEEEYGEIRQTRIMYFSKGKLIRCKGDPP